MSPVLPGRADPLKGRSAHSCSMPSKRARRVEVRYLNLMLTLVRRAIDVDVASRLKERPSSKSP